MKKIFLGLLALTVATTAAIAAPGPSRIALRGFPWYANELSNPGNFPFSHGEIDMGYHTNDADAVGAAFAFPEYYILWNEGQIMKNPNGGPDYTVANHPLVQWLITYGGPKGNRIYGLKIARETLGNISPPGPFPQDPRILFPSDVTAIRNLFTQAKNQGVLSRDNYKLFQMTFQPDFFTTNGNAGHIVRMMDGVCFEVHHLSNDYWPLYGTRSEPARVAAGANWTLARNNIHGQPLEYVFYYGPWRDHVTDASVIYDPFYEWLHEYWVAGLPKNNTRMIYDLNAFPHANNNRPFGPQSSSRSLAGILKWLVGQVKGKPGGGNGPGPKYVQLLKLSSGHTQAIDAGGDQPQNNFNGANVYTFSYNPNNLNQWFEEIPRGNQHYTYRKKVGPGNFALDGGGLAVDGGNVKLWNLVSGNHNQHWRKVSMPGGNYKLVKRNAPDFVLDGSDGSQNFANVKIWTDFGNGNQQWKIVVKPGLP